MNFTKALIQLEEGKKIRRREWTTGLFLEKTGKGVKSFIPSVTPYHYDIGIIDSKGWFIHNDQEKMEYDFLEMLTWLKSGEKIKRAEWSKDQYIFTDNKEIYYHSYILGVFVPTYQCFLSIDWEII